MLAAAAAAAALVLGVLPPGGLPGTEAGIVPASAAAAVPAAAAAVLVKLLALGGPVPAAPVPTKGAASTAQVNVLSSRVAGMQGAGKSQIDELVKRTCSCSLLKHVQWRHYGRIAQATAAVLACDMGRCMSVAPDLLDTVATSPSTAGCWLLCRLGTTTNPSLTAAPCQHLPLGHRPP